MSWCLSEWMLSMRWDFSSRFLRYNVETNLKTVVIIITPLCAIQWEQTEHIQYTCQWNKLFRAYRANTYSLLTQTALGAQYKEFVPVWSERITDAIAVFQKPEENKGTSMYSELCVYLVHLLCNNDHFIRCCL